MIEESCFSTWLDIRPSERTCTLWQQPNGQRLLTVALTDKLNTANKQIRLVAYMPCKMFQSEKFQIVPVS